MDATATSNYETLSNIPSAVYTDINISNSTLTWLSAFPSTPQEFFLLPLRLIYRVEIFVFVTVPRQLVQFVGFEGAMASLIDNVAALFGDDGGIHGNAAAVVAAATASGADEAAIAAMAATENSPGFGLGGILQSLKKFGGVFNYVTSRWSLTCLAVALLLNRVTVYASTRRHISLKWNRKLALRIVPIVLFVTQILTLLRAMRCQTSPEYSAIRYGTPGKHSSLDYAGDGGVLYNLSSGLLRWEDDEASCSAASMGHPIKGSDVPYGSFSLLWPVFLRLCLGHFVETLSSALQGRTHTIEGGMSTFEHSLAFAEAEAMISHSIGLGLFGLSQSSSESSTSGTASSSTSPFISRTRVLERLNVTPELLLIALISCCNSLVSNILDVFGKQIQFRFVHTATFALCYMGSMVWGLFNTYMMGNDAGLLNFPTVSIVGFVPHLLMLVGIITCAIIYCIALLLTAYSLPADVPHPTSFCERLALAHANMQGSSHFQNIRFNMHEDFYASLVRIGYTSLTAASEAVFLNEGKSVVVRRMTWLEEDRLAEIIESERNSTSAAHSDLQLAGNDAEIDDKFNFEIPDLTEQWESGYAREKKLENPQSSSRSIKKQSGLGSVGAFQGPTRCFHGFSFFKAIFMLLLGWWAFGLIKLSESFGIPIKSQWLMSLAGVVRKTASADNLNSPRMLDFWILTDEGVLELPENHEFDVEKEMRKREKMISDTWGDPQEAKLDNKLYNWWKAGGSWGNQDQSEDYSPPNDDWDDTTSVISTSTNADSGWESCESDGRRTPTQANPYPDSSQHRRSETPVSESLIDTASLARLLDPKDKESKHEAQILSSHLLAAREGRIMTRSRFKKQLDMERARVLTSAQYINSCFQAGSDASSSSPFSNTLQKRPTPEEESEFLEKLILSRRLGISPTSSPDPDNQQSQSAADSSPSWATGASGLGPDGPQCVVCQTSPRSIITWPCRCLCICEDCRFSLAMNNFGSCVTCRREVTGFVRLWVP